jgi:hemerythrin-like domain-containing protein
MKQDATALLKQDHAKVKDLLEELTKTTERSVRRRTELLKEIEMELKIHMKLEEEIFYPAFKDAASKKQDEKMYYEAVEEHHAADVVLMDVKKSDPGSLQFGGKAKVLKELVEHHVQEEEKEMFPQARKVMDKEELKELGARMAERKAALLNGGGAVRSSSKAVKGSRRGSASRARQAQV